MITMRIDGSLPPHIARAYGVKPGRELKHPAALARPSQPQAALPINSDSSVHRLASSMQRLVAARVAQPVSFEAGKIANAGSYPLYTRAADRIEAAVAIQLGRAIDITG